MPPLTSKQIRREQRRRVTTGEQPHEWDRKTGQATRSICTGAKGC